MAAAQNVIVVKIATAHQKTNVVTNVCVTKIANATKVANVIVETNVNVVKSVSVMSKAKTVIATNIVLAENSVIALPKISVVMSVIAIMLTTNASVAAERVLKKKALLTHTLSNY